MFKKYNYTSNDFTIGITNMSVDMLTLILNLKN